MEYTCCFCGKKFSGFGNDPWPVNNDEDAKCCDDCNWEVIIPVRMKAFSNSKANVKKVNS